jgi:glyoxylase-like metal-dependent hydrolase (beta-lactamase superfamily II)
MQIYPGSDLIECEILGRPLYLPLLQQDGAAMLLDCGTSGHAAKDIPAYLDRVGPPDLRWVLITHPDGDHCGGNGAIHRRYPGARFVCGEADRQMIESPEFLFSFRYDAFRQDHGIFFDPKTAAEIMQCFSGPQEVAVTAVGGETIRLGADRLLEIWHLPGHSHGHLGVYDRNHKTLYYGDAIQGAGYRSLDGGWALCPTYLYVDAYLETIRTIEESPAEIIVGCHWPVCRGKEEIRRFCAESRDFVSLTDRLVAEYLNGKPRGVGLRELCDRLSPELGQWPHSVHLELANVLSGHLDRGVEQGRFACDRSERPFRYRSSNAG